MSRSSSSTRLKKKGRSLSDSNATAQNSVADAPAPSAAPAEIAQTMTAEAERVGEAVGQSAQATLDQAQAALGRVQEAAGDAKSGLEAAVVAASSGVGDINMKAFNVMKASADAALDYFSALASALTLPDVVAVQTEFMRKQFETMNAQTREFAKLAEELSARSFAPINQTFARTFGAAGERNTTYGAPDKPGVRSTSCETENPVASALAIWRRAN